MARGFFAFTARTAALVRRSLDLMGVGVTRVEVELAERLGAARLATGHYARIARDEHGNALGGVRTPSVDVPISTLSGEMDKSRSIICSLFGSVTPFDAATLEQLRAQLRNYMEAFHDDAQLFKAEGKVTFNYESKGITHQITAKVDRLDQLPEGGWRIADYKTGESWKKYLEPKADDLQMGVYAMALPWLIDPTAAAEGDIEAGAGRDLTVITGR